MQIITSSINKPVSNVPIRRFVIRHMTYTSQVETVVPIWFKHQAYPACLYTFERFSAFLSEDDSKLASILRHFPCTLYHR